ncbi:MAG TPA: helix-turn-helix domain-containing protein [Candidatus Dormibacteraeota bacterium]|nr:helix-turn-helix domain-containing protein [Candidatus Dormibacteraeota bacterium]
MFELFLRVQPSEKNEDPHNLLSKKFPGARFALWCNDHTDILEIESDGLDSFQQIQKELEYYSTRYKSKIIDKTLCQDKFQLVARTCLCGSEDSITVGSVARANNFLQMPPPVFFGGWEYHRLVGFDDNDVRGLLKGLDRVGKTEILHKGVTDGTTDKAFLLSLGSLFGNLTEKQMKALLAAVESGYYEIPKRTTADELATKLGQPRSTLEEHIRKAESKVVLAMAPYMMMYARVPESPFTSKTRAAGDTVGARFMKQLAVQTIEKSHNN